MFRSQESAKVQVITDEFKHTKFGSGMMEQSQEVFPNIGNALRQILHNRGDVLRVRLVYDAPAPIAPLHINVDKNKND